MINKKTATFDLRGTSNIKDAKEAARHWDKIKDQKEADGKTKPTKGDIITKVLMCHKLFEGIEFTKDELIEISDAVKVSGKSFGELLKKGMLREVRVETTANEKREKSDLAGDPTSTVRGVAHDRILLEVNRLIAFNKGANPKARYRINANLIRSRVNPNYASVKKFFLEFNDMLEGHHAELDIISTQNRIRKGEGLPFSDYHNKKSDIVY